QKHTKLAGYSHCARVSVTSWLTHDAGRKTAHRESKNTPFARPSVDGHYFTNHVAKTIALNERKYKLHNKRPYIQFQDDRGGTAGDPGSDGERGGGGCGGAPWTWPTGAAAAAMRPPFPGAATSTRLHYPRTRTGQ
ncbi:jg2217, partial [Pararge aegeria aegeria]